MVVDMQGNSFTALEPIPEGWTLPQSVHTISLQRWLDLPSAFFFFCHHGQNIVMRHAGVS